jgi:hypothetical protein
MHLIKYNDIQIIKHNSWHHPYKFRHRSAIIRESTNTKDHKSNTPFQVLTTVTVIFKVLKWWKSRIYSVVCFNRIHNFKYSGIVTWQSGTETCRGDTYQELCSIICILLYFIVGHYTRCKQCKMNLLFRQSIYVLNQITICILATTSNFTHDETRIWLSIVY